LLLLAARTLTAHVLDRSAYLSLPRLSDSYPSSKVRQRASPLDMRLYVSIVREHVEHLRKLSTEMSETLSKLEQMQTSPTATGGRGLLAGVAELNNNLFATVDIFYKRFGKFLETPKWAEDREDRDALTILRCLRQMRL
jgi:hypothetical protein